ncbi:hypothetical protein MTY_1284 [Moorella thermoacetica Y72]|uniref:Uncharacterized protein n=1 Tax=Moorella thermoacetica Y72 TaxID=1325331 RepID=A0A0S6UG21_NEOTH|nr:hypothetical protein MTY_1284 [Moorella thermoacetica Y72]
MLRVRYKSFKEREVFRPALLSRDCSAEILLLQ